MLIHGPGPGHRITAPLGSLKADVSAQLTVKKWFTSVQSVMNLYFGATGGADVKNDEVIIFGNAAAHLKYANIKADSERIKKQNNMLPPDVISFSSPNIWMNLTHDDIVKGSVQVFDDGEDERILIEGVDYEIDYKEGRIKRIQLAGKPGTAEGGSAGSGSGITQCAAVVMIQQIVVVHYFHYTDYCKGVDYHINYQQGIIARLASSRIAAGERVFVDYKTETNIDVLSVESAIDQAHTAIMQKIAPALEGTVVPALYYAETYFALSYLALASAADMLEAKRSDEVESAAGMMMQLANVYEEKGWEFLSPFLIISAPRISAGKVNKNHSWVNY